MAKKPVIFFLSKSGAGKDTQADLLLEKFHFDYINTGDMLRALRSKKNLKSMSRSSIEYYEAHGITAIIDQGQFVPTLSVVCHWRNALLSVVRNHKKSKGVVFVGVARKIGEAMALHDFFETWPDAKKHFRIVPILLDVSDQEVKRRLLARKQCIGCRKVIAGLTDEALLIECHRCGGRLEKRKDDTSAGITSRLKEYREYVVPVLRYFKKNKLLITLDGEGTIAQVHQRVMRKLTVR